MARNTRRSGKAETQRRKAVRAVKYADHTSTMRKAA